MKQAGAFGTTALAAAVAALRRDLLAEGGPKISTMRNYRFAILVYDPAKEFELRRHIRRLSDELRGNDWNVLAISLQRLLLDRVRAAGDRFVERTIAAEASLAERDPLRARNLLIDRVSRFLEGADGLAADVIRLIDEFADKYPTAADRTLILLGRTGALYPFFRSSALLKHLDGKTRNLSVVLLYPGVRHDRTALSFMGELEPDRDYRPRIYS